VVTIRSQEALPGFPGKLDRGSYAGAQKSSHNRRSVMKAFVVEKYGQSGLRPAQVPDPTIGLRDVLVRVSAASINPLDKMVRNGEFKLLLAYKTPFVLGHDVAGVVTRVGPTCGTTRSATRSTPDPATCVSGPSRSTLPSTKSSTTQRRTSPSCSPATRSPLGPRASTVENCLEPGGPPRKWGPTCLGAHQAYWSEGGMGRSIHPIGPIGAFVVESEQARCTAGS